MILFAISCLLVILSSYFITSIIAPRKSLIGVIYLLIAVFSQIVLTFEILSLFNSINIKCILILNTIFLFLGILIWFIKSRTFWYINTYDFRKKFINSLKLDKTLIFLTIGLIILFTSSFIMCCILPISNSDALGYHVARSLFWSLQGNLNYFTTADIRNLCSPINTEILYTWILVFIKKDLFLGIFSFIGYLLSIISICGMLSYIGYTFRKRFWTVAILSSFASVMIEISSTETDIIIAGLICASIYLFWTALRTGKKIPIFMSSLAYALAIGTKTTAFIILPGFCIMVIYLCLYFKKYKPVLYLILFGIINFLLFASYNYIQNYLNFNNFIGSESFITTCKNHFGFTGAASSTIKYIFDLLNFSGIQLDQTIINAIQNYKTLVLEFYYLNHIPNGIYTSISSINSMNETGGGLGPLGFLVFIPCVFISLFKPLFNKTNRRAKFICIFSIFFLLNLFFMALLIAYMSFNIRFIMTFVILAAPVLVYSYTKNKFLKYTIITIAMYYLCYVSLHIESRPFCKICDEIKSTRNLKFNFGAGSYLQETILANFTQKDNIIMFLGDPDCIYLFKVLVFKGYNMEISRLEDFDSTKFSQYNILILPIKEQLSSVIMKYKYVKNNGKYSYYYNYPVYCSYIDKSIDSKTHKKVPINSQCDLSTYFLNKNYEQILYNSDISQYYRIYRLKH